MAKGKRELIRSVGLATGAISDYDGGGKMLLIESVGTMFSPPRPLNVGAPSSFVVIIARDADQVELELVAPTGLFQLSSWQRPGPASQDDHRAIRAEWVD